MIRRAALVAATLVVLSAALIVLAQMGGRVRQQIDNLGTANSDSTQWSLAQVDVEVLALKTAILSAEVDEKANLDEVRRRFDILYSRIATVSKSPLYVALRDESDVVTALARIDDFLSGAVPQIDGDDAALARALPDLLQRTEAIRPLARQISLEGVSLLAREADSQRALIADTLSRVSMFTSALLLILLFVLALLLYYARRARVRAEKEGMLRSRLASIIANSLDAVLVVGKDGRIVDFNGAAEEIFGYSRDEAIGARMEDLIVPEHLRAAHEAGMDRYLRTGEKHVIGKGRVKLEACRKSGEVFPIEISISSARSEAGEIFVSFVRDISRRVAAEQELIKARDDAVAGEQAKADLIAVMSHEIRTPLNGMLGTLELLDPNTRGPKDAAYLEIIRASGEQLLHHVDSVLEVSRAEAGKINVAREPFSIGALVRELVESQRGAAEQRGNTLDYRIETGGGDLALGDPLRIRQVLLNLVGNAIKFTRNGTISVEADRLGDGESVEFRVRDTGIGIAESDRDRVFDEFVTLDASYARAAGGTGLGLAIVKRMVAAMGGRVGLDSAPGVGSVFRVSLPLPVCDDASMRELSAPVEATTPKEPGRVPPRKILIVEDNRINRIVLRDLLEQDGHEVDEVHDGQQGVEQALRRSYDLVFMDISMPVLDGVEATRAIRRSEARGSRLPVVALTAHALPADKERFRAAGMDEILVKPITRDGLRAVLEVFFGPGTAEPSEARPDPRGGSALDRDHLDMLADTLGPDKTSGLVHDFLSEMTGALETIEGGLENSTKAEALVREIHHAAGSAALLGAERLRRELARLEDRLKKGEPVGQEDARDLAGAWRETVLELDRYQRR